MTYKRIVLAGGSGFLGQALVRELRNEAEEIIILSRRHAPADGHVRTLVWDARTAGPWSQSLQGADLLINLCGKNVNCRYSKKNKAEIFASRLEPTDLLNRVLAGMDNPPPVFINLSSATIYRHAEDRPQDEATGELGTGFSVDVCKTWENTFFATPLPGVRKIALRMGIVLGKSDSVFPRLRRLAKLGLGGHQGNGCQMVSWLHEDDAAAICNWVYKHPEVSGVLNCTAPNPATNRQLMSGVRRALGVPFGLPCPAWLLEMGAWLIGTETELILKSRWVMPANLLNAGYRFKYPKLDGAIKEICKN